MFRINVLLVFVLLPGVLAGCLDTAPSGSPSPYVGQTDSEIRGLSAEEIAELRSGAGMGLARPAELNGYPGPLHVLELGDDLGLTAAQRVKVQALRDAVVADASALGEEILLRHGLLEERFRMGDIDPATLESELVALERLYAALRYVHLKTHLDTLPILTEHQVMRYNELRGYTSDGGGHQGSGHAGH